MELVRRVRLLLDGCTSEDGVDRGHCLWVMCGCCNLTRASLGSMGFARVVHLENLVDR